MKNAFNTLSLHLKKMGSRNNSLLAFMMLALLTTSVTALANAGSKVTISSWDNKPFILEIDQERYRANGSITLTNLRAGNTRIKLIRKRRNSNSHMDSNGGMVSVLYNGTINVPRNSRVRAEVNRNRRLRILDVRRNHTMVKPQRPQRPHGNNNYNQGAQCGTSNYQIINDDYYHVQSQGFEPYSYESTGSYGGACAMSYSEFDQLLYAIEEACFSSDQIRITTQALRHNLITTDQLNQLLALTDFDSTKLELAKKAYGSLVDKENIWKVYDAFSYSSTARAFETFVCEQGY
ncbi:MAG: DUF4476 domain-containing protein [Flavobacteriales bacterium]